jgi:hypothetical protein
MAVTIDWGAQIINVPQDYLTLISGTVYELDIDNLRISLKDLEDDFEGMPYPDTHRHTAPVTLSGTTYSRFVEIINGYTITFEDGFYQVNLLGANSNIVDVLNRNSVSVVANNSSGLIVTGGSALTSEEHDKLMSGLETDIPPAVWEEFLANHLTAGTVGKALKDIKTKATLASLKN